MGLLDDGQLAIKQAIELTEIKREDMQVKIAGCMAGNPWRDLLNVLEEVAYVLPFDDVFTYEQAKTDNKVGIVVRDEPEGNEYAFTYDKEYYDQKKKEYQEREQKTYEELTKERESQPQPAQKQETKEERKEKRRQAKSEFNQTLAAFYIASVNFLTQKPTDEEIDYLINRFIRKISVDNLRLVLNAFGLTFKGEITSEDYRKEAAKVIKQTVQNESHLAKLIIYADYLGEIYKTTLFDFDGVKKMIVKMNNSHEKGGGHSVN